MDCWTYTGKMVCVVCVCVCLPAISVDLNRVLFVILLFLSFGLFKTDSLPTVSLSRMIMLPFEFPLSIRRLKNVTKPFLRFMSPQSAAKFMQSHFRK